MLSSTANKQRRYPLLLVFIACSLCITALAGPVYKKLPQPVYREQSSLVVLLDLSQSMNATDIKPSRLSRAKLELLDLLKTRKAGQTALIVYAADAFVVTPLTDDNATIANLAPSLETNMMPAQGSNLSKALVKTSSLFSQAGIINGNILVITDDIHKRDEVAIKKIVAQGHRLSVFGIGSAEGAPVPLDGGFLQNSEGAIVIPKLYPAKLQNYALLGGGLYSSLQADDSDIDKFTSLFQSTEVSRDIDSKNLNADVWQEEGYWLLLPVLFFAALWARKGWLAVLLIFILPLPQQARAEQTHTDPTRTDFLTSRIIDSKHLWSSPDQKAMKLFNSGDNEKAAENFTRTEWKASALYRNGDFEAAAKTLENTSSGNGYYNRGNALARLGKFEQAIKAYDKALELNESNDDASYNREQVKQALKKQQQDGQQQDEQNQEGEKQQQDDQQDSDQQDEQQQDEQKNAQQSDKQSSEQSENESKDGSEDDSDKDQQQQSSSKSDSKEQQQMEQEQLEQRDAKAEAEKQKQEEQQYQQDQEENQQQEDQQQNPDNANKEVEHKDSEEKPIDIEVNPMEASITEDEKATEQWLKRIPDDPGGLLRRKFYYQYKNIPNQSDDNEPW